MAILKGFLKEFVNSVNATIWGQFQQRRVHLFVSNLHGSMRMASKIWPMVKGARSACGMPWAPSMLLVLMSGMASVIVVSGVVGLR